MVVLMSNNKVSGVDHIVQIVTELRNDMKSVKEDIHEIKITNVQHKGILDEHIRRTEINEKHIATVSDRLVPIERHTAMWAGAGKLVAILATLIAIGGTLYKIMS